MKRCLAKLAYHKAVGLYVGDDEVVLSYVAATPVGPVEIARQTTAYEPEELDAVIERILTPYRASGKRQGRCVSLGLPTDRVFFVTRPVRTSDSETPPHVLLREVLQSATISIDEMVVDLMKTKPDKRLVASIVSCRKKYLTGLLTAVEGSGGVRVLRAEPAACALLRAAAERHRAPRRAKTVLRIFVGSERGLAVVATANMPFCWRFFSLPQGNEAAAILSIIRVLQTLAKHYGVESPPDAVMLHGRAELRGLLDDGGFQKQVAVPVTWHEGPGLDDSEIAFGLALGCLDQGTTTFDLARTLKRPASIRELFPWGELALQLALLLCVALFLTGHLNNLKSAHATAQAENAKRDWLTSVPEAKLLKEKKELEQKVVAIRGFLSSRIVWTAYTRDIPSRLPSNARLMSFFGVCELERQGKKKKSLKSKKSLVLRVEVPIPSDGSMPEEIDWFLDKLHGHPLLQRDFPIVELADIKRYQPFVGAQPVAQFTVICLPKTGKGT